MQVKSFRSVAAVALHLGKPVDGNLDAHERDALRKDLAACVEERGGEVAMRARATILGSRYATFSPLGRQRFFELLMEFDVVRAHVDAAVASLLTAADVTERTCAERTLRAVLVPSHVPLLRAFNSLPTGVKSLVEMRANLLEITRTAPHLQPLEADFKELLVSWFDVGFLEMRRITWDAPASLLEKLGRYEAVHEVRGWAD